MKRFMPLTQGFSPGKTELSVKTEDSMCADRTRYMCGPIRRVGTRSDIALNDGRAFLLAGFEDGGVYRPPY